jgi:hypothetical protein
VIMSSGWLLYWQCRTFEFCCHCVRNPWTFLTVIDLRMPLSNANAAT